MILELTSRTGRTAFLMTREDLAAAVAFNRARCVAEHGPEEGERVFRSVPLAEGLRSWLDAAAVAPVA